MASRDISLCNPILQEAWEFAFNKFCQEHPDKPIPFLTATYRSSQEQDQLYAQGRTKPGKRVTNLKGGQSKHNTGKAFDIAFKKEDETLDWSPALFKLFAMYVLEQNPEIVWGGSWKKFVDNPHFEI